MNRDPRLYLDDIAEAISAIESYTQGLTREAFSANGLVQDAVVRRIEIIGEAARQLPQAVRDRHPEVRWADIIGMRNVVTHHYFGVRVERVWEVVQRDLPVLKPQIEELRKHLQ